MKILLADADRDFLSAYERLLTRCGHQVLCAFDGTQIPPLLAQGPVGMAILHESLPRMPHDQLIRLLREEGIPVIVLTDGKITARVLTRPALACAYLPFPFLPEEILGLMERVVARAEKDNAQWAGIPVDQKNFRFTGAGICLTEGEMTLLEALDQHRALPGRGVRAQAEALNKKLSMLGRGERVRYLGEIGYGLVNDHE